MSSINSKINGRFNSKLSINQNIAQYHKDKDIIEIKKDNRNLKIENTARQETETVRQLTEENLLVNFNSIFTFLANSEYFEINFSIL